jgi:3-methylfumaryl-CoA hydratase
MFAGGRVRTFELLRLDQMCQRTTKVVDTAVKTGRSGPMTFVTVEHVYTQDERTCIVEEHDIVYREGTSTLNVHCGTPKVQPPSVDTEQPFLRMLVDETALFRFSALTFNAHRIHYDSKWAKKEGYPGLVIHGPLQALLMGELHRRHGGGLVGRELAFRLRAPAVGTQHLTVVPDPAGISVGSQVLDTFGNVTAVARVTSLTDDGPAPIA